MKKYILKRNIEIRILEILCFVISILTISPLIYAFVVSFLSPNCIYSKEINLSMLDFTLTNYQTALRRVEIFKYLSNSLIIALICCFTRTLTSFMAGYAMTFMNFKGKNIVRKLILLVSVLPQEALFIQNYSTVTKIGLTNSYIGICSIYIVSALSILICIQSLKDYPRNIRDASLLDGCNNYYFFTKILIPTNRNTLFAVIFTNFVTIWNVYLWPIVITNTDEMRTSQIAITMIKGRDSPDFGPVMAATILSIIPIVIVFIIFKSIYKESRIDFY